jgi:hypothetical protein
VKPCLEGLAFASRFSELRGFQMRIIAHERWNHHVGAFLEAGIDGIPGASRGSGGSSDGCDCSGAGCWSARPVPDSWG